MFFWPFFDKINYLYTFFCRTEGAQGRGAPAVPGLQGDHMNGIESTLASLVLASREPAMGVGGGKILILNSAARERLGLVEGENAGDVLPGLVLGCRSPSFCASLSVGGRRAAGRFTSLGEVLLCRLSLEGGDVEMSPRSGLEHSLRSALADLRLSLDRLGGLAAAREDRDLSDSVSRVSHGYYRLSRIVLNLTAAEAIEQGAIVFAPVELDMARLLRELVWTVEFFAKARGIDVSFKCREEELPMAADRELVEQMILNLISNSLLHLESGGAVSVSLTRSGGSAIISVDDNGSGIPSEELPGIFGEGSGLTAPPGIGLRLVRAIAELHGGAFLIESRPGRGTAARVMLPMTLQPSSMFSGDNSPYRKGGMEQVLTQLSTWLRSEDYDPRLTGD